ncbi:hypothetical protein ACFVZH_23285 [Streptomyces sp. NPDC059534]|uniref:hypothetical protein n=1 Tax=Streptomyces sp. NPDC059534 TaxID=3346859 RepID=UPI0036B25446
MGTPLIALGLIGGNLRALPRVLGVEARLVRRAARLSEAAAWAAGDYERAVAEVREAGPQARGTAELGRRLTARLDRLLDDAIPAAGLRDRLRAGPEARQDAARAVAELRRLLADARRDGLAERFTQTSVELLRGQDADRAALAAAADFERDPAAYQRLWERLTGPELTASPRTPPPGRGRRGHRGR